MIEHKLGTYYCRNCKEFYTYCTICLFDANGQAIKCEIDGLRKYIANKCVDECKKCSEY